MLRWGSTAWATMLSRAADVFCVNASRSPCGLKWSANPSAMASAPENGTSQGGVRTQRRVHAAANTADVGDEPDAHTSGIATLEGIGNHRVFACALTLTPPPITMPSINAT